MVAMSAASSVAGASSMRLSLFIVVTTGRPAIVPGQARQGRHFAHPLPHRLGRPATQAGTGGPTPPQEARPGEPPRLPRGETVLTPHRAPPRTHNPHVQTAPKS